MSVWEISGPRGHSAQIETTLGSNIKQEKVVLKFFARRSSGSQRTCTRARGTHPPAFGRALGSHPRGLACAGAFV